jgi:hypothetical protein
VIEWLEKYKKPVVLDEIGYEGDVAFSWGNLTAEEMVERCWTGYARGGYPGHGECYTPPRRAWSGDGRKWFGTSVKRLAFMKKIMDEAPASGINPLEIGWNNWTCAGKVDEYYLYYLGRAQPCERLVRVPVRAEYRIDVIDTWNMTITPAKLAEKRGENHGIVKLPSRPYMAVRVRKMGEAVVPGRTSSPEEIPEAWRRSAAEDAVKFEDYERARRRALEEKGMLVAWRVAGPFGLKTAEGDEASRPTYLEDGLPAWEDVLPPEEEYLPDARWTGKDGGDVSWRRVESDVRGFICLDWVYEDPSYAVAVARAWIQARKGGTFTFKVGSDDSICVRINGLEVHRNHVLRAARPDEDVFETELREGWNDIVVKVAEADGGWGFYFRVEDPDNVLEFHAEPEK